MGRYSNIQDEVVLNPEMEQMFYRIYTNYPSQYYGLNPFTGFYDASHFIVANRSTKQIYFEQYEVKKDSLVSINKTLQLYEPDSRFKNEYQTENFEQIAVISQNTICMVTKNHIDFWKKGNRGFESIVSYKYRSHHRLNKLKRVNFAVRCLGANAFDEVFFETYIKNLKVDISPFEYVNILFKINYSNHLVEYIATIPENHPNDNNYTMHNNSLGMYLLCRPGSDSLFYGTEAICRAKYLSFQHLESHLKNFIAGLVQSNYVVALDKTHLRCVELPEFVALAEEVKKRKAETKKNLQLYFDKDVASIISEYACLRSPSRNEVRLSQHYSSFYRSTNKKYEDLKLEIRMDNRAKGRQLISK